MLDHGLHPPRSREKKRNPRRQHVHHTTRPRSYGIGKVWEAVTSRCLGNGRSDARCKKYGGVKSIICYLCFMQHAWSCYFFYSTPDVRVMWWTGQFVITYERCVTHVRRQPRWSHVAYLRACERVLPTGWHCAQWSHMADVMSRGFSEYEEFSGTAERGQIVSAISDSSRFLSEWFWATAAA